MLESDELASCSPQVLPVAVGDQVSILLPVLLFYCLPPFRPNKQRAPFKTKLPPQAWLDPLVEKYWLDGENDVKIAALITLDIEEHPRLDPKKFTIGDSSVKRARDRLGLQGTRKQVKEGVLDNIPEMIKNICVSFPNMGARHMVAFLRIRHKLRVPEAALLKILGEIEPEAVAARKHRSTFKRGIFYSASGFEITPDPAELSSCPFSLRHLAGVHVTCTSFLLPRRWRASPVPPSSHTFNGIPLLSFSDTGKGNNGIANCHSSIRQQLDPTLRGTLQHKWFYEKMNIKSEIGWAQVRQGFSPGFEDIILQGQVLGLIDFDQATPIEIFLFRWLAIPWLQRELDEWRSLFNATKRRASKHKILPQGIPDQIRSHPRRFNLDNYMVSVPPELFDEMEAIWAPPDHAVFNLTPPKFTELVTEFYKQLGQPIVGAKSLWIVYAQLLQKFEQEISLIPLDGEPKIDTSFVDEHLYTDDEEDKGEAVLAAEFTDDEEETG
ncbi:hypothetical protein GGX14DRAFT_569109 [Mycena pura]|uniref:Uncharacterized protein n=1 Tax=Mycena pura TaxID=153505 RepID=A0AAD6VBJ1_9AGAR|nr:hypothetical protein GGX14DRAFT_569109 [Mycena pura]